MNEKKFAFLDLGFNVVEGKDRIKVSGRGDGLGIIGLIALSIAIFLLAIFPAAAISSTPTGVFLVAVEMTVPVMVGLQFWKRTPWSFDLTEEGIEKGGKIYPYDQIGNVEITNGHDKQALHSAPSTIFFGGVGTVGAGAMAAGVSVNAMSGVAHRIGRARNHRVSFTYGRKRVYLAKHLRADTAASLFEFLNQD